MSLHDQQGYNAALCRDIGLLCMEMEDPEEAGRWLLMSDMDPDPLQVQAIETFLKSCSHDRGVILSRLPRAFKRVEFDSLPEVVRRRLGDVGIHELPGPSARATPAPRAMITERLLGLGFGLILILLLLSTAVGLATIVGWLV